MPFVTSRQKVQDFRPDRNYSPADDLLAIRLQNDEAVYLELLQRGIYEDRFGVVRSLVDTRVNKWAPSDQQILVLQGEVGRPLMLTWSDIDRGSGELQTASPIASIHSCTRSEAETTPLTLAYIRSRPSYS